MFDWWSEEEEQDEGWWHAPSIMPLLGGGAPLPPDPNGLRGGVSIVDPAGGGLSLAGPGSLPLLGMDLGQPNPVTYDPRTAPGGWDVPMAPEMPGLVVGQPPPPPSLLERIGTGIVEQGYYALNAAEDASHVVSQIDPNVVFDPAIQGMKDGFDYLNGIGAAGEMLSSPRQWTSEAPGLLANSIISLYTGNEFDQFGRIADHVSLGGFNEMVGYPIASTWNWMNGTKPPPRPLGYDLVPAMAKDALRPSTIGNELIKPYVDVIDPIAQRVGPVVNGALEASGGALNRVARAADLPAAVSPRYLDDLELPHDVGFAEHGLLPEGHPGAMPTSGPPVLDPLSVMPVDPVAAWESLGPPLTADPMAVPTIDDPRFHVAPETGTSLVVADPAGTALVPFDPGSTQMVPFDDAITPTTLPDSGVHAPTGGLSAGQLGTAAGFGGAAGAGISVGTDAFRALVLGQDVSLGEVGSNAAFGAATGAAGDVGSEIVSHGITSALGAAPIAGVGTQLIGSVAGGGIVDGAIAGIGSTLSNGTALENGEIDAAHATANVMVDTGVGLTGGLAGAGIGATIGSFACPVFGTAIGAGLGFAGGAVGSMGVSMLAEGTGFSDWAKQGIGDNLGWAEDPLKVGWSGVNGAIDGAMTGMAVGGAGGAAMGALSTGATAAALGFCMGGPLGALALGGLGAGLGAVGGGLMGAGIGLVPGMGIGAGLGLGQGISDWWNGTNVPAEEGELAAA